VDQKKERLTKATDSSSGYREYEDRTRRIACDSTKNHDKPNDAVMLSRSKKKRNAGWRGKKEGMNTIPITDLNEGDAAQGRG